MSKNEAYLYLLSLNYEEAINYLLDKYGPGRDDYFKEKSYQRFLKGEIKNISRGKYARGSDGLECHHIDENKFLNMAESYYIKKQVIPFKFQRKERLVYCDLIEHTILHALISKETNNKFGYPGYVIYLSDKIRDWYLDKNTPEINKWQIASFQKSYISSDEAFELLKKMNNKISEEKDVTFSSHFMLTNGYDGSFPKTLEQYYTLATEEKIREELRANYIKDMKENDKKNLELKPIIMDQARKINSISTRKEITSTMYNLNMIGASSYKYLSHPFKYSEKYKRKVEQPMSLEVFEEKMAMFDLDGILKNIQGFLDLEDGKITSFDYSDIKHLYSKTVQEMEAKKKAQEEKTKEIQLKKEMFYSKYPAFESNGINYDINRQEINAQLFGYDVEYSSFIKFQTAMKSYSSEELLEKLHLTLLKKLP